MTREKESIVLVHIVRNPDTRRLFNLVVAGFEPVTIHNAPCYIDHEAIQLVGQWRRPTNSTSAEDPMIP